MKSKQKILTILGTRPEVIRLSTIIPKVDQFFKNILVHTGQNFDYELDKIFFKDLGVRKPDYFLRCKGSFANQLGIIASKLEKIILNEKPKKFLVLGDTNSSLGSIIAKRLGIQVFHMEAGNRSFNSESPEEVNRKLIDHSSDILMPYTQRSMENLIAEGIERRKIFITGNPINEVMNSFRKNIDSSTIKKKIKVKSKNFILVTLHRQENVDNKDSLNNIFKKLAEVATNLNKFVVFPIHPRTKKNLKKYKIKCSKKILLVKPIGFFDFINLEQDAYCVITDSGTVQEECAILKVPVIVARDSTERPETMESGSAIISGKAMTNLSNLIKLQAKHNMQDKIREYDVYNVSSKVLKILSSNHL
jgi:UDP-N-acetylglucosamine 2-epimerase (non-hydrolysing)